MTLILMKAYKNKTFKMILKRQHIFSLYHSILCNLILLNLKISESDHGLICNTERISLFAKQLKFSRIKSKYFYILGIWRINRADFGHKILDTRWHPNMAQQSYKWEDWNWEWDDSLTNEKTDTENETTVLQIDADQQMDRLISACMVSIRYT